MNEENKKNEQNPNTHTSDRKTIPGCL